MARPVRGRCASCTSRPSCILGSRPAGSAMCWRRCRRRCYRRVSTRGSACRPSRRFSTRFASPTPCAWRPRSRRSGCASVWRRCRARKVVAYLVDHPPFYDRPGNPYAGPDGREWPDNHRRFGFSAGSRRRSRTAPTPIGAPTSCMATIGMPGSPRPICAARPPRGVSPRRSSPSITSPIRASFPAGFVSRARVAAGVLRDRRGRILWWGLVPQGRSRSMPTA